MATPLRIAFFGPAGSGKTTHAQMLRAKYKGDVLSFATPLKKAANDLFGDAMTDERFARKANQQLGQVCRTIGGPGFWIDKLVPKISPDRNCFVDDVRYVSEYYALNQLGFIFVRLNAIDDLLRERRPYMTPEQWTHESESSWVTLHADLVLYTDDPVDEVHKQLLDRLAVATREAIHP